MASTRKKPEEYLEKIFGDFTITKILEKTVNGRNRFEGTCKCGKKRREFTPYELTLEEKVICKGSKECRERAGTRMGKAPRTQEELEILIENTIGKTFGDFYIEKYLGTTNNKMPTFLGVGNNGKVKNLTTSQLKNPEATKCRHSAEYKREKYNTQRNLENRIIKSMKTGAATRNINWNLDDDFVKDIIHKPCFYCGVVDGNSAKTRSKVEECGYIDEYRYNGIDRVNPEIGYEKDNCVACCGDCNLLKHSRGFHEFFEKIEKIYKHSIEQFNGKHEH